MATKTASEKSEVITIPTVTQDKLTGRDIINPEGLEPELRKKVVILTNQLQTAMTGLGTSAIEIGRTLKELEMLLKPRKIWVPYLNSIPGFSTASAYRYINAYETAQDKLPKVVLDRVLALGVPMIGTKDEPYGKYTKVITDGNLRPPSGKDVTALQADDWIKKVVNASKEAHGASRARTPDAGEYQRQAYVAVLRRVQKIPTDKRISWLHELFGFVLGNMGIDATFNVEPMNPPREFTEGSPDLSQAAQTAAATKGKGKGRGKK